MTGNSFLTHILTAYKGYGDQQLAELGNQMKLRPLTSPMSPHQISVWGGENHMPWCTLCTPPWQTNSGSSSYQSASPAAVKG